MRTAPRVEADIDRALFEEAPVGLAFLDTELRYLRVNAALAVINGMPVEAHLGRSVDELWPDLDPRVGAGLREVLRTGVPIHAMELQAETPAQPGSRRTFLHDYRRVTDPDGRVLGLSCSVMEITALKAAERRGRRMLDGSLEQMPLGVVVADADGRVILRNPASDRIWEGSGAPGSRIADGYAAFHSDGRRFREADWPLSRSLRNGEVITGEEIEIETFAGHRRTIEDVSAPIRDEDGSIIGAVAIFADVTARREAAELRDAFLGMLSHELRTPITSIFGAASILDGRSRPLPEDVQGDLIHDVRAEADRLYRLVENLLVLARAERGATAADPVPLLLRRLVPRIVESEAVAWPGIKITVTAPEEVSPVRADEAFVELILRNLIGNAAKYAPGPIEVRIGREGSFATVDVLDEGSGIPEAELARAFELFHRVRQRGSESVPGSGIGLFVVRHLAEAMGGTAWARNRPEGGLDVGFSVPVDPEAL